MNGLQSSIKKFVSNKNTVTILGVLLCIIILYGGYKYRIQQQVSLTRVPYAKVTIQPKTKITSAMVDYMDVPAKFLKGNYYKTSEDVVGKYSNYNTMIAQGSIFYDDLVTTSDKLPDSVFLSVADNETVINYKVNMDSTYANSMMPGDYINIYFKANDTDGSVMFGKFISNIKILDVKDGSGQHVFADTTEARTPAYMLFSLPEDMHLLFRKALYLGSNYGVELTLVPNTVKLKKEDTVMVNSEDIQNYINDRTQMISVDEILSNTSDAVSNDTDVNSNKKQDNEDE